MSRLFNLLAPYACLLLWLWGTVFYAARGGYYEAAVWFISWIWLVWSGDYLRTTRPAPKPRKRRQKLRPGQIVPVWDWLRQRPAYDREAQLRRNGGHHTARQWKALCRRYGNRCLACRRQGVALTKDHIRPVSLGGTDDISNIQPLCRSCNSRKGAQHIDYR